MKSEFLDLLDVVQVGWKDSRAVWDTHAVLRYRSAQLGGLVIHIPARFITDLASVPRVPVAWLVAGGRGNRGAVVHDFPYQFGYWLLEDGAKLDVDRPLADSVFHEALLADSMSGAGTVTAQIMWAAVRSGGRGVWSKKNERARVLNPIWAREWGVQTA